MAGERVKVLDLETARAWYPTNDPVHGFSHILRVLKMAEHLAELEGADLEIVRAAALLHDAIDPDNSEQAEPNARRSHHLASALFARRILHAEGWSTERIAAVEHCIRSHRFRDDHEPPASLEAQVLFDADKLDAIGAIGVARAVAYAAQAGQPFFAPVSDLFSRTGQRMPGEPHSAYHEHIFKLDRIPGRLYCQSARQIAAERQAFMRAFFERISAEIAGEV
jgi:uncharacterized protein